jgi:hypothetical protein
MKFVTDQHTRKQLTTFQLIKIFTSLDEGNSRVLVIICERIILIKWLCGYRLGTNGEANGHYQMTIYSVPLVWFKIK